MPRDYTALRNVLNRCIVPGCHTVSNTMTKNGSANNYSKALVLARKQLNNSKIPAAGPDNVLVNGVVVNPRSGRTRSRTNKPSRKRTNTVRSNPRMMLPQFVSAQLDVFDARSFGVKVPDESSAPSAVAFTRVLGPLNSLATGVVSAVYRYHPATNVVIPVAGVGTNWTFQAAYAGGFPVTNASALNSSFGALRTVAFGIKIATRQSYTAASGFVHIALVPDVVDQATWSYPLSVSAMEYAPAYRRVPVADLIENDILVMSKFTDATAFRYYDPSKNDFASAVNTPMSTTGWLAIMVTFEGPAGLVNCLDIEYVAHYEGLTSAAGGQGVIEVTRASPHSPSIMAATSYVVEELQQIRVIEEAQNDETSFWDDALKAFKTGVDIANGVSQIIGKIGLMFL